MDRKMKKINETPVRLLMLCKSINFSAIASFLLANKGKILAFLVSTFGKDAVRLINILITYATKKTIDVSSKRFLLSKVGKKIYKSLIRILRKNKKTLDTTGNIDDIIQDIECMILNLDTSEALINERLRGTSTKKIIEMVENS